jgi:carbon monoxide dehydrogenase subunit G
MAAIAIDERFTVDAPPAAVWAFLVDPRCVVSCVPGGELGPVLDDRTFDGAVRVAVGPLTLSYAGRVRLAEVDEPALRVKIVGRARERAGPGSARLTLESWLAAPPEGPTEVTALARLDVAGRIVELGRGVLEPLAHLVFQEFAASVRASIEAEEARRRTGAAAGPAPARAAPLRAVPLVLRALRAWLSGWLSALARARVP